MSKYIYNLKNNNKKLDVETNIASQTFLQRLALLVENSNFNHACLGN